MNTESYPFIFYRTSKGICFNGDALEVLPALEPDYRGQVQLVLTSPPFPFQGTRPYPFLGPNPRTFMEWYIEFIQRLKPLLTSSASVVIEAGPVYEPGLPIESLWQYELPIRITRETGLVYIMTLWWYYTNKMAVPMRWVAIEKIRPKNALVPYFWFAPCPRPKTRLERWLEPMRGTWEVKAYRVRPSGHRVRPEWKPDPSGKKLPDNVIESGNSSSASRFLRRLRERGIKAHPTRFPEKVVRKIIELLSDPDDIVLDFMAGSNTVGAMAEQMGRKWVAIEINPEFWESSKLWFENVQTP